MLAAMARKKPSGRGGRRARAGRPTLFEGKRLKLAVTVTEEAYALVKEERARLEPEHGTSATDGAATESLIRKGAMPHALAAQQAKKGAR